MPWRRISEGQTRTARNVGALYRVSAELNDIDLLLRIGKRIETAMLAAFQTAPELRFVRLDFPVFLFHSSMVGLPRRVLEAGAPDALIRRLRRQRVVLGEAYLTSRKL